MLLLPTYGACTALLSCACDPRSGRPSSARRGCGASFRAGYLLSGAGVAGLRAFPFSGERCPCRFFPPFGGHFTGITVSLDFPPPLGKGLWAGLFGRCGQKKRRPTRAALFFAQREYLYQNNFMSSSALSTLRTASAEV